MKSLKYGLAALAVALAGVVAPATNTFAEETNSSSSVNSSSWIQVTPVSSRVVLRPGQELEYSMVVANIGTDKFNYSVYAAPYSVIDEDYNVSFSNETNRTQLARWIKFIKEDGTTTDTYKGSLEPNEKHTVNYQISVPEDVPLAVNMQPSLLRPTTITQTKILAASPQSLALALLSMAVLMVRLTRRPKSPIGQFLAY